MIPSPCPRCGTETAELHCAACGHDRSESASASTIARPADGNFVTRYFQDLGQLLWRPSTFFSRMPRGEGSVAGALTFALVTHWAGQALAFLWQSAIGRDLIEFSRPAFRLLGDLADVDHPGRGALMIEARDRLLHWMWGAGSVVADPFITLATILFTSFFVFIGARILVTPGRAGAPERIDFETVLRIVCFGTAPAILAGVPLAGSLIATLGVWIVTTIGVRETYRVGWGRASTVALFPKVLFSGIILFGLLVLGLFALKFVAQMF